MKTNSTLVILVMCIIMPAILKGQEANGESISRKLVVTGVR